MSCRIFALWFACALLCSCGANSRSSIEIRKAWSPATPPGSGVAAVYAELVADHADTLLGASTPIADRVEMHVTQEQDGMMQMRPLVQLQMQPGQPARFEPGGMHIMLNGVRQVLPVGTVFPLTLRFAAAGNVQVTVKVVAAGATP